MALFRSIATVGGWTMVSRVLGFARDMLIANVIVFLDAFLPLRGWNLRQFDAGYLAKTLAGLVTSMIGTVEADTATTTARRQA